MTEAIKAASLHRFKPHPEYKDSGVEWLGKIPAHWRIAPLFTVARECDVRNVQSREANVLSLSYGQIVRRDISANFGLMPKSFETYQIVVPGNIVLRLTDLQNDKRSLRVGLVKDRGAITSAYVALEMGRRVTPQFGFYLLHSYDVTKVFYTLGAGVRQTMKFEDLKWMPILEPEQDEQRAVAAFLDRETAKIDALVAKKERLIELLQEKRTALITQTVTKGLNPNVPMKDSGNRWLGKIPTHWEAVRVKHTLLDKISGPFGSSLTKDSYSGSTYRVYGQEQVIPGDFAVGDYYITESKFRTMKRYAVQAGDVLLSCVGTFGKATVVPEGIEPGIINPRLILLRPDRTEIVPAYLELFLKSGLSFAQMDEISRGGTMDIINLSIISALSMPLPPKSEQHKILGVVRMEQTRINSLLADVRAAIDRLKELRTALISAAVTGKIDVREEPAS